MNRLFIIFILLLTVLFSYNIIAQVGLNKSKPAFEKGKIAIKVKEGIGPLQKQEGLVSFGINSIDKIFAKYEVNKLSEMFIHNSTPKNSSLPDLSRIYKIEFPAKYNVVRVAKEISNDPNIEYAEPIPINYPAEIPNDPLYNNLWFLPKILAPEAWNIHKGEDGDSTIILAITDTGCDWDHSDLIGNLYNNLGEDLDNDGHTIELQGSTWGLDPGDINGIDDDFNGFVDDFIGWNFDNNNNNPNDYDSHGTRVAGIACGVTNNSIGIASVSYNLKLIPVRGLSYNSIIYAAENGADVINCSWGGAFSYAGYEAVNYASGLGSIIVAASHNYNNSVPIYPAAFPKVIAVAAVTQQDEKTAYSNYGDFVDVSSPGPTSSQRFLSTALGGGYTYSDYGTSFSTPLVTGLVGLLRSYHPTWTRDEILKQFLYSTDNIDQMNPSYTHMLGTGRINAFRTLADSNVAITQELKMALGLLPVYISPGSKPFAADSIINLSVRVQNYSHFLDANILTISLSSSDPDIQILDGSYSGVIPADTLVDLINEFQIKIASDASTHTASITFQLNANPSIVGENVYEFEFIINPSGSFVWDGLENISDFSGTYIENYLRSIGYPVTRSYSDNLPLSYKGLDALFLSFGNYGNDGSSYGFDEFQAALVQDYLENGGKVYLEGGEALGWDQAGNLELLTLFGLSETSDGTNNIINALQGQSESITEGMLFTSSTQQNNTYIDTYLPDSSGKVAFIESGYGNVGVQNSGIYGQKTFCFSYSLSRLVDAAPPSTKNILFQNILNFFGVSYEVVLAKDPYIDKTFARAIIDTVLLRTRFLNDYNHQFTPHLIYANLDSTQIDSLTLYDDGLHGDSLSNDGLYGGYIPPRLSEDFYSLSVSTIDHQENNYLNLADVCRFTTAGPVKLDSILYTKNSNTLYYLRPFVRNEGTSKTITGAKIRLYCDDPFVSSIYAGYAIFPNIEPGSSVGSSNSIFIRIIDSLFTTGRFNIRAEITSSDWLYWNDSLQVIVGVEEELNNAPTEYSLLQNYPNPFNPTTKISYAIPQNSFVELKVFNLLGQEIATLVNEEEPAGNYEAVFDASALSNGVYFYRLQSGDFVQTRKMILLK
jgi:hypothetical protein